MRIRHLIGRSFAYYGRHQAAVALGVAVAVSVLAGALLVGESVRASLREILMGRLGNTDDVVIAQHFFRSGLAADLESRPQFARNYEDAVPIVLLDGAVSHQLNGRRLSKARIYGVAGDFWRFHGVPAPAAENRQILINERVALELEASAGDPLLVTVQKPSLIPLEFLHGRRDQVVRTARYSVAEVMPASGLGEFSIQAGQAENPVVFVPLAALQGQLELEDRVNALLLSRSGEAADSAPDWLRAALQEAVRLEDLNLNLRKLPEALSLESATTLLEEETARAAQTAAGQLQWDTLPILTYLANSIRTSEAQIPYSLVSAADLGLPDPDPSAPLPALWLNSWAAQELQAGGGEEITLEYFRWAPPEGLVTETARFRMAGVVPLETADPDFTPLFPGVSDAASLTDWNPPFPLDLSLVRPRDEEYWEEHRTTPKAFISLSEGRRLWESRFGQLTSIRLSGPSGTEDSEQAAARFSAALLGSLEPSQRGFNVLPVRADGLKASRGATDFGEFFVYFSFFLVVASLLLTALFFRLGIEQRLSQLGLLRALGFPPRTISGLLLGESALPALAGLGVGLLGAWAYAGLMMYGLRTWWVEAVGTTALTLHYSAASALAGGAAVLAAALAAIFWSLRSLLSRSPRSLLLGTGLEPDAGFERKAKTARLTPGRLGLVLILCGCGLLAAALMRFVSEAAGFFAGGSLLLAGLLSLQMGRLRSPGRALGGHGAAAVLRLGLRNASQRPGRSLLCIGFIALAAFIIVSVESFRQGGSTLSLQPDSGTGGFSLLAESALPLTEGPAVEDARLIRLRLRPGEDASCLNLYRPENPRVLGVPSQLIQMGRFRFRESQAVSAAEEENPWLLLEKELPDGAIPVIGDAHSLNYVLHVAVGEEIRLDAFQGEARLRVVGALAGSIFQGELLMSESNFIRTFPDREGYQFFLLEAPAQRADAIAASLEDGLSDFGLDVTSTLQRLAAYQRVENTYLSTFQLLGGLGLILGTVGLATVLLRNVLERRREFALLRAVGYRSAHFSLLVLAENAYLLLAGLLTGLFSALIAIYPALSARGEFLPDLPLHLAGLVVATGMSASLLAAAAAIRAPLLSALRRE